MSVPCHFAGRDFRSISAAARALGVRRGTLWRWIDRGLTDFPEWWGGRAPNAAIPVPRGGRVYPSIAAAARAEGRAYSVMHRAAQIGGSA